MSAGWQAGGGDERDGEDEGYPGHERVIGIVGIRPCWGPWVRRQDGHRCWQGRRRQSWASRAWGVVRRRSKGGASELERAQRGHRRWRRGRCGRRRRDDRRLRR